MEYIFSSIGELLLQEQLCDLHCVSSSTLSYLVTAAPQVDSVIIDKVFSDPADINCILVGCEKRHWIDLLRRLIIESAARSFSNCSPDSIEVKLVLCDHIDGYSV